MTEEIRKKRGRKRTGIGTMVGVRLQPDALNALDAVIAGQPKPISRPEAIRSILLAWMQEHRLVE